MLKLPLGAVGVVWIRCYSMRNAAYFNIRWMAHPAVGTGGYQPVVHPGYNGVSRILAKNSESHHEQQTRNRPKQDTRPLQPIGQGSR